MKLNELIEYYQSELQPYRSQYDYIAQLLEALSLLTSDVHGSSKVLQKHYCLAFYQALQNNQLTVYELLLESMDRIFRALCHETMLDLHHKHHKELSPIQVVAEPDHITQASVFNDNPDYRFQGYLLPQSDEECESPHDALTYDISPEVRDILQRIQSLIDYIKLFRGKKTIFATKRLLSAVEHQLFQVGSRQSQIRAIKTQMKNWFVWMDRTYGGRDIFSHQIKDLVVELLLALEVSMPHNETR